MLKGFAWQLLSNRLINISFFKSKSQNESEKKGAELKEPSQREKTDLDYSTQSL